MDKRGAILMSEKEREGAGSFGAGEAKGDSDGGGDTAVGYKLPAMLAGGGIGDMRREGHRGSLMDCVGAGETASWQRR